MGDVATYQAFVTNVFTCWIANCLVDSEIYVSPCHVPLLNRKATVPVVPNLTLGDTRAL